MFPSKAVSPLGQRHTGLNFIEEAVTLVASALRPCAIKTYSARAISRSSAARNPVLSRSAGFFVPCISPDRSARGRQADPLLYSRTTPSVWLKEVQRGPALDVCSDWVPVRSPLSAGTR